ncbi:MAG: hypothetical protein NZM42_02345 [Gemmatales bacterium]|nr:hypothetical protein [Gemmatales bacterium]MDW8222671.1 hypothetical protein [Gemmatales bacterium]
MLCQFAEILQPPWAAVSPHNITARGYGNAMELIHILLEPARLPRIRAHLKPTQSAFLFPTMEKTSAIANVIGCVTWYDVT